MRAHTRTHPTKGAIIEKKENEEEYLADWRNAFRDLIDKYTEVGLNLRGARQREDLTQKALADLVGCYQSDICNYEHGRKPIGKNMAKRLAKALNTDYRHFL